MILPVPIVSIVVAFTAIFILNRDGNRVDKSVSALHAVGIAASAFLSVRTSFLFVTGQFIAKSSLPVVRLLVLVLLAWASLHAILFVFRRIIGIPAFSDNEEGIHICFGGDIEDDREYAASLRVQLLPMASGDVDLFDVHEFERRQLDYKRPDAAGAFVYVLSEEFVEDASVRMQLLQTAQKADIPGYMYFYLLRGTDYPSLCDTYPEMERLGNRVMIGTDADAEALLAELPLWARRRPLFMRRLRRFARTRLWFAHAGIMVGILLPWFYATAPIVWLLLALSFLIPDITARAPYLAMTSGTCQFVAILLYRQRALDFWPFIGACLKFKPSLRKDSRQNPSAGSNLDFWKWAENTGVQRKKGGGFDRCLATDDRDKSIDAWLEMVRRSRRYTVMLLLAGGLSVSLAGFRISDSGRWALLGAILGFFVPAWVSWAQQFVKRTGYWHVGLTSEEIERTARFFPFEARSGGFVGNASLMSHRMHRNLRRQPPRVFISYSWKADEKYGLARELHRVLDDLDVDHFYDKESIRSSFAPWRASVCDALLQSTHVFAILHPNMPTEQVVDLEIRTAVQRLHTDIFPAIICVADADTMKALQDKEDLPFELQFLLQWAPRITPTEAVDPTVVSGVIEQRARQGRFRDFRTMFSPKTHVQSFFAKHPVPISSFNE